MVAGGVAYDNKEIQTIRAYLKRNANYLINKIELEFHWIWANKIFDSKIKAFPLAFSWATLKCLEASP